MIKMLKIQILVAKQELFKAWWIQDFCYAYYLYTINSNGRIS